MSVWVSSSVSVYEILQTPITSTSRPREISKEILRRCDLKLKLVVIRDAGERKTNVLLIESLTSSQITYDDSDKTTRENDLLHISGTGKSTTRAEKMKNQSSRSASCTVHHRYAARGVSSCTGVNSNKRTRNYSEFKHTRLRGRQGLAYSNDAQELGYYWRDALRQRNDAKSSTEEIYCSIRATLYN